MDESFHVVPDRADAVAALMARIERMEAQNRQLINYMRLKLKADGTFAQVPALESGQNQEKGNEELAEVIRRLQRTFDDNMERWDGQIQQVIATANDLQKNLCESMDKISSDVKKLVEKSNELAEPKTGEMEKQPNFGMPFGNSNIAQCPEEQSDHSSELAPTGICSSNSILPTNSPPSATDKSQIKSISKSDEMILLVGGWNEVDLKDILLLDGNQWITSSISLPKGFVSRGATFMNGDLYIVGGSENKHLYKLEISITRQTATQPRHIVSKWQRLPNMNDGRAYITNSFVNWNGCLWIFGGSDSDRKNVKKSVERYDPKLEKWFDMPDMKHPRYYASVTVLKGKFIVCGGINGNFMTSVECFDSESGVWTELNSLPTPVAGPATLSYGNDIILLGGNYDYPTGTKCSCAALKLSALEANAQWIEIQPIEYRRECFPAAVANDEIYIIGGINGATINKVEIFDGEKWRIGPALPTRRACAGATVIPKSFADAICPNRESILLLGGMTNHGALDEILLVRERKWINLPLKLPKKSSAAGAVYLDGEIYIVGGDFGKKLYKLDNKFKWIELAEMHEERCYISCVAYNGEIWAFGSSNNSRTTITKGVERYNPKENTWTKMQDMNYARSDAAAAVWNGKFIVSGGWNGKGCVKTVECYDPESGIWTELNDMPGPRHGHRLVNFGDSLILLGGHDGTSYHKTVWELSSLDEKGKWKNLPAMNSPHQCFAAEITEENFVHVLGGSDGTLLDKTEIFDGLIWRQATALPSGRRHAYSVVIPNNYADILYAEYKFIQDLD